MLRRAECIGLDESTQRTETSKYLQERKSTETPLVAASENGIAQTTLRVWGCGLSLGVTKFIISRIDLENSTVEGESPVRESYKPPLCESTRVAPSS